MPSTLDDLIGPYAIQVFSGILGFVMGVLAVRGSKYLYRNIKTTKADRLSNLILHATIPPGMALVLANPAFAAGYAASAVPLSYIWYKQKPQKYSE